jgi:ribonuclease Z
MTVMFDSTFLGTLASVRQRTAAIRASLSRPAGHRIMVDCGEGTQRQLLQSGAGFRRLLRLLLTHGHFDHVLAFQVSSPRFRFAKARIW